MPSESRTRPLYSKAQLEKHNTKDDCWISINARKIYDFSLFYAEHPGTDSYLLDYAGQDVTEVISTKKGEQTSNLGFESMCTEYLVGYLATEEEARKLLTNDKHVVEVKLNEQEKELTDFRKVLPEEEKLSVTTDFSRDFKKHHFLDLNKPLVKQVLFGDFTREFYIDQIHRPRHYGKGSAPLFGGILEPISKTSWWVVPIIWYPVVFYFLSLALSGMWAPHAFMFFGVGIFVWTLIEYSMHRFLFHLDDNLPESNIAFTLHFLLHGVHHYLPMDKYRLVMPPALFTVLCTPFYKLVFAVFPYYWACAGFAGGLFGYVGYDVTHYLLHHSKLPPFMRKLKKYHLEHHYKNYELGFGVTSWFWDKAFGTYLGADAPIARKKAQ